MTTSIIIPVYNQQQYISRAIRSALSNHTTSSPVSIVVVNDGSTDSTPDIIQSFLPSIDIIHNDQRQGLPFSLNKAIKSTTSKYVFRLDSDDYIHDRTIDILSFFLDNNNHIDAVACDYLLVDDLQDTVQHVSSQSHPIGCGILFRKDHLISLGLYDPQMLWHEDKEFMSRFNEHYSVYHLPLPLYRYHIHGQNMTLDSVNSERYLELLRQKESPNSDN